MPIEELWNLCILNETPSLLLFLLFSKIWLLDDFGALCHPLFGFEGFHFLPKKLSKAKTCLIR